MVLVLAACSRLPAASTTASAAATAASAAASPASPIAVATPWETATPSEGTSCEMHYSAQRCLAIAEASAESLGLNPARVASIAIVPDPNSQIVDGQRTVVIYGGDTPIYIEVTLVDGSSMPTSLCGGISSGAACSDDPHLSLQGLVPGDGYHDTPCTGDPPTGCATPLPMIDPKAAAEARPIVLKRLEVPIDHVGAYEVDLGEGSLPNGILTRTSYALGDDWPDHASIANDTVRLEVRSREPDGQPFENYYQHGWRAGTERIRAVLVFSVGRFDPGAILDVRDLVVE